MPTALPGKHETVIRGGAGLFYGPTVSNTIGDVASLGFSTSASYVVSQAESQSALRLRDGFPAVARPPLTDAFGAVAPGQKPNTSVAYFNPKQIAPISYQYNLNLQREVARGLLVEVGYLANISHHLTANDLSLNQVAPQLMGPGDAQARRPFPQFSNVTWINPSIGNSTYHGGFVRAEKRFGRQLLLPGPLHLLEVHRRRGIRQRIRHYRQLHGRLQPPPGQRPQRQRRAASPGAHPALRSSHTPHPSRLEERVSAAGRSASWKPRSPARPSPSSPQPTPPTPSPPEPCAPTFCTARCSPRGTQYLPLVRHLRLRSARAFTFGNSPRSGLRGAPLVTTDVTLEKSIHIKEQLRFDLRAEFYNILNHANFNLPGATLGAADFGLVTSARPGRTIQLAGRLSF